MNYEQKYKEALGWMQSLYGGLHGVTKEEAEHYFPELKESEDERIKRTILELVSIAGNGNQFEEIKDWLEKQGEHKPILDFKASDWYVSKVDGKIHNMYYSADKVEPKFHEGEWIIHQGTENIYQVIARIDNQYQLKYGDNYTIQKCADVDRCARLWTIKDAKDGDVLVTTSIRNCPFIYRKTDYNNNLAYYYAGINGNGDFCEGCIRRTLYHFGPVSNVVPATKEQCDMLFRKMKEAGYEWDTKKKELTKISEPKTLNADKVIEWLNHHELSRDDVVTSVIPDDSPTSVPHRVKWLSDEFIKQFKKDLGI